MAFKTNSKVCQFILDFSAKNDVRFNFCNEIGDSLPMTHHSDLKKICKWYEHPSHLLVPSAYCETRDVFEGRLAKLAPTIQRELNMNPDESFLLTAAVGEIGNNCFDHNLGHWNYEAGLHFQYWIVSNSVMIAIADRGRGVFASLSSSHKEIVDPQSALELAFQKRITGRFPERRGNGLKFVRQVINGDRQRGIWCRSSQAEVIFGKLGDFARSQCSPLINTPDCGGTVTFLVWRV